MCDRARSGQVSINELKEVDKNDNLMVQLYDASLNLDRDKKLGALAALQSVVRDRKEEYTAFIQQQMVLKHLVRFLDPKIAGIFMYKIRISRVCHVRNLYPSCSSCDHHIYSVETLNYG